MNTFRKQIAPALAALLFAAGIAHGQDAAGSAAILQQLRAFQETAGVLMVAAHPDDENTQLLAYLARGRNYRTAYLSITRGDGGQNLLGPEFGEELGIIRTEELLGARRIDGAQQFFTRAIDFGYSKDYEDTLKIWGHQEVLSDVVRVIREFRPDVIITRFSTEPSRTHGHHTASAVLALEAFKAAADPKAFPDQHLAAWQATRIVMNRGGEGDNVIQMEISGTDPVTGDSLSGLSGRSRAMHKTQGFGRGTGGGVGGGGGGQRVGPRPESFVLLGGSPAKKDIMEGIDTTWARYPGGADIDRLAEEVIAGFDPKNPAASVSGILAIRTKLAAIAAADPIVDAKRRLLDKALQGCFGLSVSTTMADAEVVPGETMRLRHTALVTGPKPVKWLGVRYPSISRETKGEIALKRGEPGTREASEILPTNTPVSQPYWLREEPTAGMYQVADPTLIGRPENPSAFPVEQVFDVGGQMLVIPDEPVKVISRGTEAENGRVAVERLEVIPPVSLSCGFGVRLFSPGGTKRVSVEARAYRAATKGVLRLEAPAGWKVEPAEQPLELQQVGDHATISFNVTAPAEAATAALVARAEVNGVQYSNQRIEIRYPHIPPILLQPTAQVKAVDVELACTAKEIGYLPGAGDSVAEALEEMGCHVVKLSGADLTSEKLGRYDAVVIGIRAFNVRADLPDHVAGLADYASAGGTVIVQYNTPNGLLTPRLAPYMLRLNGDLPRYRVTDENAPVKLLVPDHPVFNTPNKIGPGDWEGWVQERGLVFASEWDTEHFTPLIACSDAGEPPLEGGLLVAKYGNGYFVYTGLAWFRQLPAGVPGAYRLFANLVSLGK